ncbi:unnamed protein product [Allacma fusca]|uniref:Glycine-rich protein n=1 Tax=Allacma fusca TaxID=39272 RepID=A0A8J2Q2T8_9HEXA|nr:unnamed protein product [Allacma fusca]
MYSIFILSILLFWREGNAGLVKREAPGGYGGGGGGYGGKVNTTAMVDPGKEKAKQFDMLIDAFDPIITGVQNLVIMGLQFSSQVMSLFG